MVGLVTGFTDGYGWIETDGPVEVVTRLSELDWLVKIINDTCVDRSV